MVPDQAQEKIVGNVISSTEYNFVEHDFSAVMSLCSTNLELISSGLKDKTQNMTASYAVENFML